MSPADLTRWKRVLVAALRHAACDADDQASHLLARLLQELDPATAPAEPLIFAAADLYAEVTQPDPAAAGQPDALAWARYTTRAAPVLFGVYDPTTIQVLEGLASILTSYGRPGEADEVREQLIQLHLEHGAVSDSVQARLELAWQRHNRGQCLDAHRDAEQVWQEWTARFGTAGFAGWIAHEVGMMLRTCGRIAEAEPYSAAADRAVPAPDDPSRRDYCTYLLTQLAAAVQHQPICAFNYRATATSS